MSTRCTTHFRDTLDGETTAIVYRHHDGYPEGAGVDLIKFVDQVKIQCEGTTYGTRFNDESYLAAKYLTFLVTNGYKYDETKPLDFGGVGILNQDPMDIEYRYIVVCNGEPTIYVQNVLSAWDSGEEDSEPMFVEDAIRLDK